MIPESAAATTTPTPAQRRAIEAPPGPVLVVAGPGAGKTFCLIGRAAYLIRAFDYDPERICAVTFTNKAAGEIAERLERDLGVAGRHLTRSTLHALCAHILRQFPVQAGLQPGFGIADEEYQRGLLRRLRVPPERQGALLHLFSRRRLQSYGLSAADEQVLEEYGAFLRHRNLVDFDELILYTHNLFRLHPEIRKGVAGRWDAVLVDEFQDLSPTQYAILLQLAEDHRHVFAVGDDEQSIFGWTGADPRLLEQFCRDFGIAEPVVLDENRRSSRVIFETARRILRAHPSLFEKTLRAEGESPFPVCAVTFADDGAEAAWLAADIARDREQHGLRWGDFAVLYRRHQTGRRVEEALLRAGIPTRVTRGRALTDDRVVAEVLGSLRVLRTPDDPIAVGALAQLVLGLPLLMRVEAEFGRGENLLDALRLFHRLRRGAEHERKAAMRFVYHVENLPGLRRAVTSLEELVDVLLAQRPSRRPGLLAQRAVELTDPLTVAGAVELAAALARVRDAGAAGGVRVRPSGGLDLALGGLLAAAGVPCANADTGARDGPVVELDPSGDPELPVRLFKALQLLIAAPGEVVFQDCVVFDLETTDQDPEACGIIEIGAARVRSGEVVATFHTLVRPDRPIAAPSSRIHGYTDADVASAPSFPEVWPAFRAFIGSDILVGHNAAGFDVPVLRRHVAAAGGDLQQHPVFDTLLLARSLFHGSGGGGGARLQDLAARFGIPPGRAHHARDDALTLAGVLRHLGAECARYIRKTAFAQGLDWLGLALALAPPRPDDAEAAILLDIARWFTLGRYGEALLRYEDLARTRPDLPSPEAVVDRLGGQALRQRLRRDRSPHQLYPASVERLRTLIGMVQAPDLDGAIAALLDLVALSSSREGVEPDRDRVNLLTLHATKGLEFNRVYIAGVEDTELPGLRALRDRIGDEFPEARRLLYVGMTRARHRLVLTRVERRHGKPTGGTMFLEELGLAPKRPDAAETPM